MTSFPLTTKLREGNVFTSVCDSVHGGAGSLSRGVSVQGGLYPGGLYPGVSIQGVSVQEGVSVQGVSVQMVSVQGVTVQGVSVRETTPYGNVRVVYFLLECILVKKMKLFCDNIVTSCRGSLFLVSTIEDGRSIFPLSASFTE